MNTWIFQANPDRFDIDTYLDRASTIIWGVRQKQYASVMNSGDRVFIWRAAGKQKLEPGIIASGWLIERPHVQPDDSVDLWREKQEPEQALRVRLRIDKRAHLSGMLRAKWLMKDDILSRLRILHLRNNTNYLVAKKGEAERLSAIWDTIEPMGG